MSTHSYFFFLLPDDFLCAPAGWFQHTDSLSCHCVCVRACVRASVRASHHGCVWSCQELKAVLFFLLWNKSQRSVSLRQVSSWVQSPWQVNARNKKRRKSWIWIAFCLDTLSSEFFWLQFKNVGDGGVVLVGCSSFWRVRRGSRRE